MKRESEPDLATTPQAGRGGGSAKTPGFTAEVAVYRSSHDYRTSPPAPQPKRPPLDRLALAGYDPRWPILFELERRRIRAALGDRVVSVEHVGSSSVPYLGGRPEIDILVGVRAPNNIQECVNLLAGLGYITTSHPPSPPRDWWLMTRRGRAPFELLLTPHLSPVWKRHLWFRDHLRRDPTTALAYHRWKSEWAKKYGTDTIAYKEAKRRFVAMVESVARPEASSA